MTPAQERTLRRIAAAEGAVFANRLIAPRRGEARAIRSLMVMGLLEKALATGISYYLHEYRLTKFGREALTKLVTKDQKCIDVVRVAVGDD